MPTLSLAMLRLGDMMSVEHQRPSPVPLPPTAEGKNPITALNRMVLIRSWEHSGLQP